MEIKNQEKLCQIAYALNDYLITYSLQRLEEFMALIPDHILNDYKRYRLLYRGIATEGDVWEEHYSGWTSDLSVARAFAKSWICNESKLKYYVYVKFAYAFSLHEFMSDFANCLNEKLCGFEDREIHTIYENIKFFVDEKEYVSEFTGKDIRFRI